jgi:hypothetical protein
MGRFVSGHGLSLIAKALMLNINSCNQKISQCDYFDCAKPSVSVISQCD